MMTRKQFLGSLVALAAFGACKKSDDDGEGDMMSTPDAATQPPPPADAAVGQPDAPPMMACSQTQSQIGSNHGHALTVPGADVTAGVEKTYNITGASSHPHTVVITAAMFGMLKANKTLTVTSSNDAAHTHVVTVTC